MTSSPIPPPSSLVRVGWLVGAVSIVLIVRAATPSTAVEIGILCAVVAPLLLMAGRPRLADKAEQRYPILVALWLFSGLAWVAVVTEHIPALVAVVAVPCLVVLTYFARKRSDQQIAEVNSGTQ